MLSIDFDGTVGIDFGNSVCCVGVWRENRGEVEILTNDFGNSFTPSYVAFSSNGELIVGESAYNHWTQDPRNTIFDIKDLLGRRFDDPDPKKYGKNRSFTTCEFEGKLMVEVEIGGQKQTFHPECICAALLSYLKIQAERVLRKNVKKCVISVPSSFKNSQKETLLVATKIAGLTCLRIVPEPTLSAISYYWKKGKEHNDKEMHILVYDMGSSKCTVALISLDEGIFEVKSAFGSTDLGGSVFDERMIDDFCLSYKRKHGEDLRNNPTKLTRLRKSIEKAKRNLSTEEKTKFEVEGIEAEDNYYYRTKFEDLNNDLFLSIIEMTKNVLEDCRMNRSQIDDIFFVGGSSYIPRIRQLVSEYFGKEYDFPVLDPQQSVVIGASILGATLSGEKVKFCNDESEMVVLTLDITSHSIGIETAGGIMTKMISRKTLYPCRKSNVFTTYSDNAPGVVIHVYEGERAFTRDNNCLGRYDVKGIPPAPRGVPKIEITFSIDNNGVFDISGRDLGTGRRVYLRRNKDCLRMSDEQVEEFSKLESQRVYRLMDGVETVRKDLEERCSMLTHEGYEDDLFLDDVLLVKKCLFHVNIGGKKVVVLRIFFCNKEKLEK